ncbi:unnamed protein product, partial [marine sediment metagenome]
MAQSQEAQRKADKNQSELESQIESLQERNESLVADLEQSTSQINETAVREGVA